MASPQQFIDPRQQSPQTPAPTPGIPTYDPTMGAPGVPPTQAPVVPPTSAPAPTPQAPTQAPAPAPGVPTSPAGTMATTAVQPAAAPTGNQTPLQNSWADLRSQMFLPGEGSPDVMNLRALLGEQAGSLFNTPDRGELASEYMDLFNQQNRQNLDATVQNIGRDAARFGRIGSGVTTSRVGDAFVESERNRANMERQLAADAAGQTLNDRLGALRGVSGIQSLLQGQDVQGRAEGRQERSYADNLANQALQNRIQQIMLQDQLLNSRFNRGIRTAQTAGGFGYGQEPIAENQYTSQYYGNQAAGSYGAAGQGGAYALDWLMNDPNALVNNAPVPSVQGAWAGDFAGSPSDYGWRL